jgi:hypothetical protein
MSLTTLRANRDCDNGRTCPHISATGRGTLVVQGYLVSDPALASRLGIPAGETAVEVPLALLPQLAARPTEGLHVTSHGTAVLHGPAVSDPGNPGRAHHPRRRGGYRDSRRHAPVPGGRRPCLMNSS